MEQDKEKMFSQHREEARTVRKVVATVITLVIAVLVAGGAAVYFYINSALKPVDTTNKKEIAVEIPSGTTVKGIGQILEEKNIIKNGKVFYYYIKFKSESGFQAGDYKLSQSMDVKQIIERLKTGTVQAEPIYKVTIPEGKSLDQIAKIIEEKTNVSATDFMKTLDNKEFIEKMMTDYPFLITNEVFGKDIKHPLEGYLYPATYDYYKETLTIEEIVRPMLGKAQEIVSDVVAEYETKTDKTFTELEFAPGQKFTVHKLLTLASLVEEEATGATDRKKISSVFYNRMKTGMPLQTDPTVLYALGEHKDRVLYKDLEVNSPYNTYKVKGITPGPIAGAGIDSLNAALYPSETDYLYFLADSTGKVHYAKTLAEHNQLKAQYITNKK